MQYLLMCCFEEEAWTQLPEAQRDAIMRHYQEFEQEMAAKGRYLAGAKLGAPSTATTVRMNNGKTVLTDGPFAETRETIGGYHVIECQDLDEAFSIAARIPTLPFGGAVEVRPIEQSVTFT